VEAEPPARLEHGTKCREIDGVLALVVDDAAAVIAALAFGQGPRTQALAPAGIEAADHVTMAVPEHGRKISVLGALAEQEWSARVGMGEHLAMHAEPLECRRHLHVEIAFQLGDAVRILAFGGDRDPAAEVTLESAAREVLVGGSDSGVSAHAG